MVFFRWFVKFVEFLLQLVMGKPKPKVDKIPQEGLKALALEIRSGNLTKFAGPYRITSVCRADDSKVLNIYDDYYCVTTTPIPREEYSTVKYRQFEVKRTNQTWTATVVGSGSFDEWQRIGCYNWDD